MLYGPEAYAGGLRCDKRFKHLETFRQGLSVVVHEVDDDAMNWNTLRYVQRIAEHGSFLEAAEYLGRSQANLSIKVAAL